jgi:hypothetical protein
MTVGLNGTRRTLLVALISVSSVLVAGLAFAGSASASQLSAPPTDEITAEVVTVNGSGCPAGTAKVSVNSDKTAFRIRYSDYVAGVGPSSGTTDFRKNCQINLLVHIPQGFTFAIAKAEYRGNAGLRSGASAQQRAFYYWAGSSDTGYTEQTFNGPYYGTWNNIDVTPVAELVYAPCGEYRNLNINTDLKVNAGTSSPNSNSWISMSSATGSVDTIYHIDWKKC